MPLNMLFWGIYILSVLFSLWASYEPTVATWPRRAGGYVVIWILIGLLGYRVFGSAIK